MAQYTRGRISVVQGSNVVTGVDTVWYNNISVGDVFKPKNINIYATVASVVSNTQLLLATNWLGETLSGSEYQISRDFTAAFDFYEINPGDVNWAYYITQNFRKIDNLFDIMSAGVISSEIIAARDEAVASVGNVEQSVITAANSAATATTKATEAAASAATATTKATEAAESAVTATTKATEAAASAATATTKATEAAVSLSLANYKGQWPTLTGALNIPASVTHSGAYWQLTQNVADVTIHQPGVSSVWANFNPGLVKRILGSAGLFVFNSVADMLADTTLLSGDRCQTINYYNDVKGGGAYYVITPAATGTVDQHRYFDLANGFQAELVFDGIIRAKQAGIRAEDSVDDTLKIEAMFGLATTNSVVEFDPGYVYNITSVNVTLPQNVTIKSHGASFNCTTDEKAFELNTVGSPNIGHIKWYGGIFQNSAISKTTSNAISAHGCDNVIIEDAEFYAFKDAIDIQSSKMASISKNIFDDNLRDIVVSAGIGSSISKNSFKNPSSDAVNLVACSKTSISENVFSQTIAETGIPVNVDAVCTGTNVGINVFGDAQVSYLCAASEIAFWPYV